MTTIDLDAIRAQIHRADCPRGTPDQMAIWREDLVKARANNAIEDMDLDAEDEALFAMMLDEGLSPAAMVGVIHTLYPKPDEAC